MSLTGPCVTSRRSTVIFGSSKEELAFACKPSVSKLLEKLKNISPDLSHFKVCYEAGYLGFTLCRALREKGVQCEVIAPHLIPRTNRHIKTDRIDSKNLALLYSKGMLSPIHLPETSDEAIRDLIRARHYLAQRLVGLKNHILSICRRSTISLPGDRVFLL